MPITQAPVLERGPPHELCAGQAHAVCLVHRAHLGGTQSGLRLLSTETHPICCLHTK